MFIHQIFFKIQDRSPDYQTSFELIGLSIQEKEFNIGFQYGGQLGFPIRVILTTFDLQVI